MNLDIYRERTNLWTILITIIILLVGITLLFLADNWGWLISNPSFQSIARELGGLLIASVALSLVWELVAKRAFLAELMAKARLAEEVRTAGLITLPRDFYRDVDWSELFRKVRDLDVFYAYGETWRHSNMADLRALSQRNGAKVRVVLPDPDNDATMSELARRFDITADESTTRVRDATKEFIEIFGENGHSKVNFSLWYVPFSPLFSFYRFDSIVILTLYNHRQIRGDILMFVGGEGGRIYEAVMNDFEAFIQEPGGLGKRIFPPTIKEKQ